MKIQVLSQSFYPDHSGISLYATEFASYSSEKGHEVEVITGFGFYPYWKKRKEDRRRLFSTEYKEAVKILRGYIYVPAKPTTFKRVIHEVSLVMSATLNSFRAKKPDVIVVFTTPILLGFLGVILKKIYGCKLIINVQDFQLEAANSLGMAKQKIFFQLLASIEKVSYKHADMVTSISTSMYNILKTNKCLEEQKINLWPNWIQKKDYVVDDSKKGLFREKYDIKKNDIIVAYAGNVGLKQGLEILIDLAAYYKENSNLKFFIIGEGAALEHLTEYADSHRVTNLRFLPLLSSEEYISFLADLDIFFLAQKRTEFDVYFPSKLLGLIAAKKMILLTADKQSELYNTIKSNNIGYTAEYGDINSLKFYIQEILNNIKKCDEIIRNADTYVSQFERDVVLNKVLEKICRI